MVKLTYEQMRSLAELGDDPGKHTIKNRDGKVVRPRVKKWGTSSKTMTPSLGCTTVPINGSQDHCVRWGIGKGRV